MLPDSHSRTSLSTSSPGPRRGALLIMGVLLLLIFMCAVTHGATAGTDRPSSVVATGPAVTSGGTGHQAPHHPQGSEVCTDNAVFRVTTQAPEQLLVGADAPTEIIAGSIVLSHPLVHCVRSRRERALTGRTTLGRTSRWRV